MFWGLFPVHREQRLPRQSFEGWDASTNTMRVVPGKYEIMVGNSSADKDLKKITVDIN